MKNILTVAVAVICVFLIYLGFSRTINNPSKQQATETSEAIVNTENSNEPATAIPAVGDSAAVAIKQEIKKYYPDAPSVAGDAGSSDGSTGSTGVSAEQNFQITASLLAKMHLVDKYKPGICYGSPSVPPQSVILSVINLNEPLWKFVKQQYGLTTDLETYNKIKQLQGVSLTETQSGVFNFSFMDGQCQTVRYYEGTVKVIGSEVTDTVTSQESHTY